MYTSLYDISLEVDLLQNRACIGYFEKRLSGVSKYL